MTFNSYYPKPHKTNSYVLSFARFFNGFMAKSLFDADYSPTSVLNPFGFKQNPVKPTKIYEEINNPFENFECESESNNGIALALIQENSISSICKSNDVSSKVVLFRSNQIIQMPSHPSSDQLCCDFGIKTRKLQFCGHLTSAVFVSLQASMDAPSLREMELSEEYTRVITYGSNLKTTHIYDNYVVDCSCYVLQSDPDLKTPLKSFLTSCHACKKNLKDDLHFHVLVSLKFAVCRI